MVIIGDSITARYNDIVGSTSRGWWSYLGDKLDLRVIRHAERGSGFGKRGKSADGTNVCGGTTFYERLKRTTVVANVKAARVVIVAGGVNDYMTCVYRDGAWKQVASTRADVEYEIHRTMLRLAELRPTSKSSVYITAPFGPYEPVAATKAWIVPFIQAEAKAAGFRYVDTANGTLYGNRTDDQVHPNAAGNLQLYRDLYNNGSMERWAAGVTGYAGVTSSPTEPSTSTAYVPRTAQ
jgi:lysophospholipase L1-like esterase